MGWGGGPWLLVSPKVGAQLLQGLTRGRGGHGESPVVRAVATQMGKEWLLTVWRR